MRFMIFSKPKSFPPMEMMPEMIAAFAAWRDRYRPVMESFEFFAGAGGGFGVANLDSAEDLQQMMLDYPFFPFSELSVHPLLNGDTGIELWQARITAMS